MDNKLYRAISRRRVSCPLMAQNLWDAIRATCYQRQQPSVQRIAKYMSRVHGVSEDEVRRQLVHCVRDGLLKHFKRLGIKGKMTGVEQEGYQIPLELNPPHDGHDWYCFECHKSGDVICCTSCHRVYHLACLPPADLPTDDVKHTFTCATCKACAIKEPLVTQKDMNKLLVHTCARLKQRLPVRLMDRQVPSKCSYFSGDRSAGKGSLTWEVDEEQQWRVDFLLFRTVDLAAMEAKAIARQYTSLAEFEADAATIVHNIIIYHGVSSILADMARHMLQDCHYDLAEMRQCRDCYRRSNEKTNKNWFALPCNPPHVLVYAKQKGYPFWPAKVIKVEGGIYDVRFFGGPHERAMLEKNNIRDISVDLAALGVKRTAAWSKACEELRRHQQLLEQAPRADTPSSDSDDAAVPAKKPRKSRQKSVKESDEEASETENEKSSAKRGRAKRSTETPGKSTPAQTPTTPKRRGRRSTVTPASRRPGKKSIKKETPAVEDTNSDTSDDEESVSSTSQQHTHSKEEEDQVSSSCYVPRSRSIAVQTPPRIGKGNRRQSRDQEAELTDLRREFDREKAAALAVVARQHERELQLIHEQHTQEVARINERHRIALAESKRKQWCYNCEAEAIYHCCWNTAYCSTECQQSHWHKEHKRLCRRKR